MLHKHTTLWLVIFALCATHAMAAVLTNPSFETPEPLDPEDAVGWTEDSNIGQVRSDDFAHTGDWSIKSQDSASNPSAYPNTYQYANLDSWMQGQTFTAELYALTPSSDPLNGSQAWIKVSFYDESNDQLGGPTTQAIITSNPGPELQDTWIFGQISGTVPEEAVHVRFEAMHFIGPSGVGEATGTVYFDDASFTVVPEPSGLILMGFGTLLLAFKRNG